MSDYFCVKHVPAHRVNMYGMGCPEEAMTNEPTAAAIEELRVIVQPVMDAVRWLGAHVLAMPGIGVPRTRDEEASGLLADVRQAAMRVLAQARVDALRETRCTFAIKRCAGGEYAERRDFWCDLCLRQAAAEAVLAQLEAQKGEQR